MRGTPEPTASALMNRIFDGRIVPWRLKNALAYHLPLAYYYLTNLGEHPHNRFCASPELEAYLETLWDRPDQVWPDVNQILIDVTDPNQRILDVGVGTGTMLRHLHAHNYRDLAAVDAFRYSVRRLKSMGIDAREALLPDIPFEDERFDFVIASQILEHISRRHRFLESIRRVLKRGAAAAIFVPDRCLTPLDEPTHCAVYTAHSLRKVLQQHFLVERIHEMKDSNHASPILYALVRRST